MSTLSEQEFRVRSDEALDQANRELMAQADRDGFEVEFQNGVLNVIFEEPREAKFVVSPNAPVRQVWVSAMSRSYKLTWDSVRQAFVLGDEPLTDLLARLATEFLAAG